MQIHNNGIGGGSPLEQTNRASGTESTGSTGKGAGPRSSNSDTDGLQLSGFAGTLSKVLQSDSTGRSQRVAQLAAAVQSGTYQVDPAALSKAIVDHAISSSNSPR